jgi:hypothetical protein
MCGVERQNEVKQEVVVLYFFSMSRRLRGPCRIRIEQLIIVCRYEVARIPTL